MEVGEHPNDGKDPLLGGLAGLPAYPGSVPTLVEREIFLESRRRFLRRALYTAIALPPVAAAVGLGYVGFFGEDPEERARRYRSPGMGEPVILGTRERYPYAHSALRIHAEEEVRLTPERFDHVAELCTIADNIADHVAVRMKELYQSDSVTDALHNAGESEENLLQYASAIAAALRHSGCFYQPEGSLANAVDPAHERPSQASYHLDCDLLCLIALHAASRHDVPFHAVAAPSHMYLGSPTFPRFAIEMTAFRGEATGVRLGRGLQFVPQWDSRPGFSSSHEEQHKRWTFAAGVRPEQFGFFQPMSEEELRDAACGSILFEMGARRENDWEALVRLGEVAQRESERNLPGRMIPATLYYFAFCRRRIAFQSWINADTARNRQIALDWSRHVRDLGLFYRERVGNIAHGYDGAFVHHLENNIRSWPTVAFWEGRQWWPAH